MGPSIWWHFHGQCHVRGYAIDPYRCVAQLKMSAQNFIVVSDPRIEKILLERKSGSTSDRPPSYLVDLVTDGKHTAFARYG